MGIETRTKLPATRSQKAPSTEELQIIRAVASLLPMGTLQRFSAFAIMELTVDEQSHDGCNRGDPGCRGSVMMTSVASDPLGCSGCNDSPSVSTTLNNYIFFILKSTDAIICPCHTCVASQMSLQHPHVYYINCSFVLYSFFLFLYGKCFGVSQSYFI